MAKFKVYWSKSAEIDLQEIFDYISSDRPGAARALHIRIREAAAKLERNPDRCRKLPELEELGMMAYRELLAKPYRIIFKMAGDQVYVIAIIDARRDLETVLFQRILRMD